MGSENISLLFDRSLLLSLLEIEKPFLSPLLVYPSIRMMLILLKGLLTCEPKINLSCSRLLAIGTVNHISCPIHTEIPTKRSLRGGPGIRFTNHHSSCPDNILSFPHHGADGARAEVGAHAIEPVFPLVLGIVFMYLG